MESFFQTIYQFMDQVLPFSFLAPAFMKRALIEAILVSGLCGAIGVLVVNFRMAFFSDAISHSAFTGVALGVIFGIDPYVTMIGFGLLVGLGIINVRRGTELSTDTVIGVFFAFVVALGITIISAKKSLARNLQTFLFGDILSISNTDIFLTIALLAVVSIFLYLSYNRLILIGLNEHLAYAKRIKVRLFDYLFALVLALVVTVSIRTVGLLLITALLVVPAAAARNITKTIVSHFWTSVSIALVCGLFGVLASYFLDSSTGATIVLCAAIFFAITQALKAIRVL